MGVPLLLLFRKPDKRRGISTTPVTPPLTFLFDDQFTTADAAPLSIPRSCEPGPGVWGTLNDTGNRLSIAGGVLTAATGGSTSDPNLYSTTTFVRATGLCVASTILSYNVTTSTGLVLRTNTGSAVITSQTGIISINSTSLRIYRGGAQFAGVIVATLSGKDVRFYNILRTTGLWAVAKIDGAYKLMFRWDIGTDTNFPLHLGSASAANVNFDDVRVAQLRSPWTDDTNLRIFISASPSNNDTAVASANVFAEVTFTPNAGAGTVDLCIRRTDDNNMWFCRVNNADNTLKIFEVAAGVTTERSTAAVTVADVSQVLAIRANGTIINAWIRSATGTNVGTTSYTSAFSNQTATGAKISYANVASVTNWEALNVDISGTSETELARMD